VNIVANEDNRAKALWLIPSSLFFFIFLPSLTLITAQFIENSLSIRQLLGQSCVYTGLPFLIYGGYYILESIRILFSKGDGVPLGDLLPEEQSRILVIDGVYKRTRNPMLYGYLISFLGLGFILNSPITAFFFPLVYLGIWTYWIKCYEEPALEERFGEYYRNYRNKTPFLIPKYLKK
jgi:protein-S-isoprenylcysteine O-methyltransferase Ste14